MRGGTCNEQSTTTYTCSCPPDFTGNICQTQINGCEGVNCGNGTCVDLIESFECICDPGFTDTFCNTNINECETIGCVNGDCTDLVNGIECDCYPDWTGADIGGCTLCIAGSSIHTRIRLTRNYRMLTRIYRMSIYKMHMN